MAPNSWRYANGVLTDAGDEGIDAQSLAAEALPHGAVARGIDVSNFQGTIHWNQVKAAGIEFAILKVGPVYGEPDSTFERNATECERLGIPYGVYYYSYARSVKDANKEADRTLAWLGGHHPSLPVYYDLEDRYILEDSNFNKDKLAQIAQTFCNRMEAELDAGGIHVGAKYRYRQKDQAATLTRGEDGQMLLTFDEPQRAIAPGQAVVVYRGDIVLGGGTVTAAIK